MRDPSLLRIIHLIVFLFRISKDKSSAPGSIKSMTSVGSVASSVIHTDPLQTHAPMSVMLKSTLSAPSGYNHMHSDQEEEELNSQVY